MPLVALTIAGFDPSAGAGITADLAVFAAHGLHGTACITALTVQATTGVRSVTPVDAALVHDTLHELESDLPAAGVKIGMLATPEIVSAVAEFLESLRQGRIAPIVFDPVLRSSSGHPLFDPGAITNLRDRLLPLVDCITPNVGELSLLLGRDLAAEREPIEEGARELQRRLGAPLHVVVTGGDLHAPDDLVLSSDGRTCWVEGERVATTSTHGTGCAFSSALLANLMQGREPREAVRRAKRYVEGALRRAPQLGAGNGPLAHLWPLTSSA